MTEQGIVFLFSCAVGAFLGVFYDVFRILRIAFKPKWLVVFVQDIIFCIASSFIIILSVYYTNSGQVRLFGLTGCFLCFVLYHLTIGKFIMFVSAKIIEFVKQMLRLIYNITVKPVKIMILFIINLLKKYFKFMLKVFADIKNYIIYIHERGKISKMAGRGFDLYKKTKIPRENIKIINNINKANKNNGAEKPHLKKKGVTHEKNNAESRASYKINAKSAK